MYTRTVTRISLPTGLSRFHTKAAAILLLASGMQTAGLNAAPSAVINLGTAGSYGVLAGSTVTSTGPTVINGNLGLSPGSAVTGFPPGLVNGVQNVGNGAALQAKADLTTAYNQAAGLAPTTVYAAPFDLVGLTLAPGVYKGDSSLSLGGTLVLDAKGVSTAGWVFQAGSTLITASGSRVTLINGAQACNVFWVVSGLHYQTDCERGERMTAARATTWCTSLRNSPAQRRVLRCIVVLPMAMFAELVG